MAKVYKVYFSQENAVNGEHLWLETNVSGDLCYLGEESCQVKFSVSFQISFSFRGNKPEFRLIQYPDACELKLFAVDAYIPEGMQKRAKGWLLAKDFIAWGKKPQTILSDPDINSENE